MYKVLILLTTLMLIASWSAEAKVLTECTAVKELQKAKISRSFISNWICLMKSESGMNTQLVSGPKVASSYSYGIFQINSNKWCVKSRKGGLCNMRCEDLINDDIQDDINCAKMIYNTEGFKAWDGWMQKCKNKPLPNISQCRRR